ncbi:unnamed protein product [Spirodela intermedia]|uniref:Uncharacterized protein n=2 Tax=Spirodela intermedia TaxID=51605 RepID=A0A7I8KGS3_SPIIN|nr:unnamed protein product [Spirodela intermedia]CAA6660552.1 unnamed protein product [Spirodela intermedia]CAA7396903.1 unnamed protein product [Spirodela intermedia]
MRNPSWLDLYPSWVWLLDELSLKPEAHFLQSSMRHPLSLSLWLWIWDIQLLKFQQGALPANQLINHIEDVLKVSRWWPAEPPFGAV